MGKRIMTDFTKKGFPHYQEEEEDGMAKPVAMGVPWVNPDTLRTLEKRKIPRTGPRGESLPEETKEEKNS